MPSNVDEGSIATLVQWTFGELSHTDAAQLLRISNHNVETAVSKYYDQGGADGIKKLFNDSNTGWDGSAFAADRYGQFEGAGGIPTFNIEYAPGIDQYPHSGGPSGAPSRPPSRASQRSAVSTHAGDAPRQSVENGQESGVIGSSGTSGPVFGPATKDYYDAASWAMVPAAKSTEYIPDASIFYQSRDPDAPAFLKPSAKQDFLPPLLSIAHSIPLFRNALLSPEISTHNYWLGEDWWKGIPSTPTRTVDRSAGADPAIELDLIYEAQRFMTFLDKTDRAYVNAESMFQLDAWKDPKVGSKETIDSDDDLLNFLLKWSWAYEKHVPEARLDGVLRSTLNVAGTLRHSFVLDAPVVPTNDCTLYDVLDQHLFESELRKAHIVDISRVLIMKLTASKDNTNFECKIPATLYADRYLEENRAAVDAMFAERKQYEEQLTTIDTEVENLKWHTATKVEHLKKMETLTLLKTSMKAFEPDTTSAPENPEHAAVLAKLKALYENIERKLSSLEEEKKKVRDTLASISGRFRAPIDPISTDEGTPNEPPRHTFTHPYKLWGVATSYSDYYILHPKETPGEPGAMQWWHIKYSYADEVASISRDKVTPDDVLEKSSSHTGKVLLVYANDAATSVAPVPLSPALEEFAKKDNFNFLQYLSQRQNEWPEHKPDEGNKVIGNWMDGNPPNYEDDYGWNSMSAKDFHGQDNSRVSSTTLTPNTEIDDEGGPMEMQEVNGGMAAWAGMSSTASSDTIPGESMDMADGQKAHGTVQVRDVEMSDAETVEGNNEPRVEHIEVVEKKGG